jgi:predicted dehydrogenase
MHTFNINRRKFLHTAAATLAVSTLGANGLDIIFTEKPRKVALIGTGWYGKSDLFRLMQVAPVEVVALCDVDKNLLQQAGQLVSQKQKSGKTPQLYGDYRKLIAEHELDIAIVGTPDHWHALTTIEAIKSGANVYVQKPISVDIYEGEAMLATARKYNKTVQVGTQRRSTPHLIEAKQNILSEGLLGKIAHIEICCYYHMRANGNPPVEAVPNFLDYEMWTGPASMRPYDGIPHTRWWRTFMEYGNGIMGDMCIHMIDAVRWLLDLGMPTSITSTGGIYVQKTGKSNIADTQTAIFKFGDLDCVWQHRTWGAPTDPEYPWGFKIYGEKGTLKGDVHKYEFVPFDKQAKTIKGEALYERELYPEDLKEERIELHAAPATRRHMLDLLAAIDEKRKPVADIEQGHISTASCIAANISMELGGQNLTYDTNTKKFVNNKAANKLLKRPYRNRLTNGEEGWKHPFQTI